LRIAPPLSVAHQQAEEALAILDLAFEAVEREGNGISPSTST
jgi:4-aminobutyrate aminotransferase-like enzyme